MENKLKINKDEEKTVVLRLYVDSDGNVKMMHEESDDFCPFDYDEDGFEDDGI
jgi:meiotically up-regulated gene 157 (Mug157) protein